LRGYQPAFKRARDHFKDKYIREIVPKEVQSYINGLPKTWALKTATTQLQIFNMIFNHAVMEGDIEVNPCSSVAVPPGLRKTRRDAATPEIEAKVKASYKTWLLPYLILYTGLRKGEALALQYGDIIRDAKEIIVNKSVCYIKNRPTIKAPKTEKGNRTVPILYPLEGKIPKGKADHYIFSLDGGKTPLTEMQYQKLWKQYEESVKIKVSAHQLRHSFATMLFESDIDPQDAMDILGHAQLSTTREIYTHIRESRRKVIADRLNEKLKGTQDNTESTQGKA
jgi:integrase